MSIRRAFVAVIVSASVWGCSSSDKQSTTQSIEDAGGGDICAPGGALETAFHPKMTTKGPAGFTAELLDATPPNPRRSAPDGNSWKLKVTGPDGNPVSANATVTAGCRMVHADHGCGPEATVTALGDGAYQLDKVSFVMPGQWTVTLIVADGSLSDTIVIDICVD